MNNKLKNIYYSINLNLGIKRFISKSIVFIDTKLIYSLFRVLEKYLTFKIISHYGADYRWGDEKSQNLDKKKGNLGYGLFHYAMIRNLKHKRILCIGSMYGFIPYMMARACEDNKIGHVDFVDAAYDMHKEQDSTKHYFGEGFWLKINPAKHFNYLLNNKYITTYLMRSENFAKKYKYKYDYIYLDGDHSYSGALQDVKTFWSRLNEEGFLCFHDIHFTKTLKGVPFEFWKVWKDLRSMPFKFEFSNHYSGLGFIQKLGNMDLPNQLISLKKLSQSR